MKVLRSLLVMIGLTAGWQLLVTVTDVPPYILPGPGVVAQTLLTRFPTLLPHATYTLSEILLGFGLGALLGMISALLLATVRPLQVWLSPILVMTQSLPVFALAPLLVLWLGYGLASKIAMAVLIIYFPVASAFYDGLQRTPKDWRDLGRIMKSNRMAFLWHVRIPFALPSLASGLRVAMVSAPIGVIVGEWVGSSRGLGYLMLHANGRMQIDLLFAALVILMIMALFLYQLTDQLLKRLLKHFSLDEDKI
ncbi:ABC transporter permease [Kiloniella laminariae]|uniref:ABC transporter permease n=1 Tax=Kiloniella laminariae TaxID=454162 RepID=A0ABT4LHJ3_9PROT|nr:ABC transporter permease [Kiloniella laminariae]MCZ4280565.1 ABC transporter permease [Kiloniella laminariae]